MEGRVTSYAQNREDALLSSFFLDQDSGFYVDVGANDPAEDSVTKFFYDRRWRGVNIEPSPFLYEKLVQARPRDINLNIGISNIHGELSFREYQGHGLSTFSKDTKDELSGNSNPLTDKYKDYKVNVKTLKEVLDEIDAPEIDFMKIDVEGYEYEVIDGNNWTKYRPKVLCIEANHIHRDWRPILIKHHYEKVFNDGLNDYYVDSQRQGVRLDYLNGMIGRKITPVFDAVDLERLGNENRRLDFEVKSLRNQVREKDNEILRLHVYIQQKARLKSLVKDFVLKIDSIIMLQLTRRLKLRKYYPPIRLRKDATDAATILQTLRQSDHTAFVARPPLGYRIKITLTKGLYVSYKAIRRAIYRPLRAIRRKMLKDRGR